MLKHHEIKNRINQFNNMELVIRSKQYVIGRIFGKNGRVTLYVKGIKGGPVVSGRNEQVAREKFDRALLLSIKLKELEL